MPRMNTLLYVAVVLYVVIIVGAVDEHAFRPMCDIHTKNPGRRSPNSVLPSKATSDWLYAPSETIEGWYKKGKEQCDGLLAEARKELENGHNEFYTDPNNIPYHTSTPCRGRNTLYDFAGVVLAPFGPYEECPTYSACWFGLLVCGTPNDQKISSHVLPRLGAAMKEGKIPGTLPLYTKWSVRALNMLIRVAGAEIVVPDVKYWTMKDGQDVLIGQYVLTRPYVGSTQLQMRMFELYPSILFNWTRSQIEDYGMQNIASMHLGGSEGRCRPWTQCRLQNACCGCDEKSFVANTPAKVRVTDGSAKCPGVRDKPLPLCPLKDSTQPGRWISSALPQFTPHCSPDAVRSVVFHRDSRYIPKDYHPADQILQSKTFNLTAHQYHGPEWYEASGDPCVVNSKEPEEAGQSHWFYAPYTCRYHFYSELELHQCLLDQKLSHIHVAGDSMSRDLFSFISLYLGVAQVDEATLKHMTNNLKQNNVKVHSGKVLLSEGYSWDYNPQVMRLIEEAPLPDVYVTNYALAHRNWNFPIFQQQWNQTEYQYWTKERSKDAHVPRFMFFQTAKELTGRRNIGWSANVFQQDSAYLQRNYTALGLGFSVLDEFLFSSGRYDYHIPSNDGWHFGGTKRQMEVVALFNMVCNDWYRKLKHQ